MPRTLADLMKEHGIVEEPPKKKRTLADLMASQKEIDDTLNGTKKQPTMPIADTSQKFMNLSAPMMDEALYGQPKPQERFDVLPKVDGVPKIKDNSELIKKTAIKMNDARVKETLDKTMWVLPESRPLTAKESKYLDMQIMQNAVEYGLVKPDNFIDIAGKGLAVGVKQTMQSAAVGAEIAGHITNIDALKVYGKAFADQYQGEIDAIAPKDKKILMSPLQNAKNLVNPLWYAYNVGQMLPSLAVTMGAAQVGGKVVSKIAPKIIKNITPTKLLKLAEIGASLTGGMVGGGLEGAGTYRTMVELGADKKSAVIGSTLMGLASAGLNAISLNSLFSALGGGSAVRFGLANATEALTEWAEEPIEAGILSTTGLVEPAQAFKDALQAGATVIPVSLATSILTYGLAGAINWKPVSNEDIEIQKKAIDFLKKNTVNAVNGEPIQASDKPSYDDNPIPVDLNDNIEPIVKPTTIQEKIQRIDDIVNDIDLVEQIDEGKAESIIDAVTGNEKVINERTILKDLPDEVVTPEKKSVGQKVGDALDAVWNDVVVNKFIAVSDIYAFGWSTRYGKRQKAIMEGVFKAFKDAAYSIKATAPDKWGEAFKYFGTDKKLMSDFLLYMENPNKYEIKDVKQKQKFDEFRNMMLEYDGEQKERLQAQVNSIVKEIERRRGYDFTAEEKMDWENELDKNSIFPNKNSSKRYIEDIAENKTTIEKLNNDLTTADEINQQIIKNKIKTAEDNIRMSEDILQIIEDIRYMPMAMRVSRTTEKGASSDIVSKRAYSNITEIEQEGKGRRNLWEFFDRLPAETQAKYFTNPAEQLAYYSMRSGIRYIERSMIYNALKSDAGIFITEDEYQKLPENTKKEYGNVPIELVREHGYLGGLYASNAFKTFFNDNLDKIASSKMEPLYKVFAYLNKIAAPLGDLMILNPIIMARLNAQQVNLISPVIHIYIANISAMRMKNPEQYSKYHAMSIITGINTSETSVRDMGKYGAENIVDRIREESEARGVAKLFLQGVPVAYQNKPKAIKVMTAIFSASRTIAFDIMDTNTKVGTTQWLYNTVKKMKQNNPEQFNKLIGGQKDLNIILPDNKNYSQDDIDIMIGMKAYSQKYAIAETLGEYGRAPWSTRTFLNAIGRYWQLRVSSYAGMRKIVNEAIHFEIEKSVNDKTGKESKKITFSSDNIAAKRLALYLGIAALDMLPWLVSGYYIKRGYQRVRRNLHNDASFYINSGLFSTLGSQVAKDEIDAEMRQKKAVEYYMGKMEKQYGFEYQLGKAIAGKLNLFTKQREYEAALKESMKENRLTTLMMGRELYEVSSDPTSFLGKLFGKGIQGIFPVAAPPFKIVQILGEDDIGIYVGGEYNVMANRNSSAVDRMKAALTKYAYEMTGVGSLVQVASADDVPKWMKILQATTGSIYAYSKDGKPTDRILSEKHKIATHPAVIKAYLYDHEGKRRTSENQIMHVSMLLYGYVLKDKKMGVGMSQYFEATKDIVGEFKIFGGDEEFNKKELDYIEGAFNYATLKSEYLKMSEVYSAFESVREKYGLEKDKTLMASEGKAKIKKALDKYFGYYKKIIDDMGEKVDTEQMAGQIYEQLYMELEAPTQEEYQKRIQKIMMEEYAPIDK